MIQKYYAVFCKFPSKDSRTAKLNDFIVKTFFLSDEHTVKTPFFSFDDKIGVFHVAKTKAKT